MGFSFQIEKINNLKNIWEVSYSNVGVNTSINSQPKLE
jgi:hypothetical protein